MRSIDKITRLCRGTSSLTRRRILRILDLEPLNNMGPKQPEEWDVSMERESELYSLCTGGSRGPYGASLLLHLLLVSGVGTASHELRRPPLARDLGPLADLRDGSATIYRVARFGAYKAPLWKRSQWMVLMKLILRAMSRATCRSEEHRTQL